jgi:transcriptional accessory protein Tex/SPT6
MAEFNKDGSLKLPEKLVRNKSEKEFRLKKGKCIQIKKELVSTFAPKKCALHIKLSEAINDNQFIDTIYKDFLNNSEVPSKIIKINEKEFRIELGTCFKRCSDCSSLINRYKEFLDNNVIEENGNCSYENNFRAKSFCFEDYFD